MKLPMKIQVNISSHEGQRIVNTNVHHKVAHALGMRDGGSYPHKDYQEAKALNERYTNRLSSCY